MSYRLKVLTRAKRSLAAIWLSAANRDAVTRASDRLDRRLQHDPLTIGESRTGRIRVVVFNPPVAFYTVDQTARKVVILAIRSFVPRP